MIYLKKWHRGFGAEFPLQPKKSAARFFAPHYLSFQAGDFASPHVSRWFKC